MKWVNAAYRSHYAILFSSHKWVWKDVASSGAITAFTRSNRQRDSIQRRGHRSCWNDKCVGLCAAKRRLRWWIDSPRALLLHGELPPTQSALTYRALNRSSWSCRCCQSSRNLIWLNQPSPSSDSTATRVWSFCRAARSGSWVWRARCESINH